MIPEDRQPQRKVRSPLSFGGLSGEVDGTAVGRESRRMLPKNLE